MPTLPVSRSQTAGSRAKQRGRRVSSGDVGVVSPQSLRAKALSVPTEAFQTTAGIGAQEIGPAAEEAALRLKLAEDKQQTRKDAVALSKASSAMRAADEEAFLKASTEGDLSDPEQLSEVGSARAQRQQEAIDSWTGSEEGLDRLKVQLETQSSNFTSRVSAKSVEIGRAAVGEEINARLAPFVSNASQDPTMLNIQEQILNSNAVIEEFAGSLDPIEEAAEKKAASERILLGAFDKIILSGDLSVADTFLNESTAIQGMGKAAMRDSRRQLETAFSKRKTAASEAATAGAVRTAENNADFDFMTRIMGTEGVTPITIGGKSPATVTAPHDDGSEPSAAMTQVNLLLGNAQKLALAGKTALASNFMQQARVLLANHPDILASKELDKLLSPANNALLGTKLGTTWRDVAGVIPPSQEKQAEVKARGRARGKATIEAEEQLRFIDGARTTITDLLDDIAIDPTLVGAVGSLRAKGQTALGVLGDLGLSGFVDSARDLADNSLGLDDVEKFFGDPTLSALSILENSIGLVLARLATQGGGRIPVDVIKRSIDDVGLRGLKSAQQVRNRLELVSKLLNRKEAALRKGFNLEKEGTNDDIPVFDVVDGALVEVGK